METVEPKWRKSTYSGNGGADCVEVGTATHMILVRDTKDCGGAVLSVPAEAWRKFTDTLR